MVSVVNLFQNAYDVGVYEKFISWKSLLTCLSPCSLEASGTFQANSTPNPSAPLCYGCTSYCEGPAGVETDYSASNIARHGSQAGIHHISLTIDDLNIQFRHITASSPVTRCMALEIVQPHFGPVTVLPNCRHTANHFTINTMTRCM